jgi:hypothetical protein
LLFIGTEQGLYLNKGYKYRMQTAETLNDIATLRLMPTRIALLSAFHTAS